MDSIHKIKKALLIDDSNAVNDINSSILNDTGFFEEVLKFTSAMVAISYLEAEEVLPELILLDLSMPQMNGFDFLDEYIKLDKVVKAEYSPILVIVSDYLDFENFSKSKDYKSFGVLDHIKKPIDKEDIQSLLNDHFQYFEIK